MTEKQAEALLRKYAPSLQAFRSVHQHGHKVAEVALRIAAGTKADKHFLFIASILHDIGRLDWPPTRKRAGVEHGHYGAAILRREKLLSYALVAERHVGSGITKAEARTLGIPVRSYLPVSLEEKIICLADSLVFGTTEGTLDDVLRRYKKELGTAAVKRTLRLQKSIIKAGSVMAARL